ncbi:hypothetical protein LTR86_006057 [Recurvomyces mirabilis]|nr:hypothetical protein LTR86_006057 [Recurvomyces mirabilis]
MAAKHATSDPLYDRLIQDDNKFGADASYEYFEISVLRDTLEEQAFIADTLEESEIADWAARKVRILVTIHFVALRL